MVGKRPLTADPFCAGRKMLVLSLMASRVGTITSRNALNSGTWADRVRMANVRARNGSRALAKNIGRVYTGSHQEQQPRSRSGSAGAFIHAGTLTPSLPAA